MVGVRLVVFDDDFEIFVGGGVYKVIDDKVVSF